jgi:hypothetical protein
MVASDSCFIPRRPLPKASSIDLEGAKDDQEGETKVVRQQKEKG